MHNNSDYYSGVYLIGIRYWTDSFSEFSSLKSSVNCLNTKDKIFAPMDDDRHCLFGSCPCRLLPRKSQQSKPEVSRSDFFSPKKEGSRKPIFEIHLITSIDLGLNC